MCKKTCLECKYREYREFKKDFCNMLEIDVDSHEDACEEFVRKEVVIDMDNRFVATYDNGKQYIVDREADRENERVFNNVIKATRKLNELNAENKRLLEVIEKFEEFTGESIDDMLRFYAIMEGDDEDD